MIKFSIDEKEYELPEYVTIEKYTKIFKLKDILSDQYFAGKLISIMSDCPLEDILEGDAQEVNYLAAYIMNLIPNKDTPFVDRFELDGVHYGFFPKWRDLTYAEFVDIDTISTKKVDELLDLLHILTAIMYRPIINERSKHDFDIEKYNVKSMELRAELFKKKLDVRYVLGAQTFFTRLGRRYSTYTQTSSITKMSWWMKLKVVWRMRKIIWVILFKKHSGGTLSQTELLETILPSTTKFTKRKY